MQRLINSILSPYKYLFYLLYSFFDQYKDEYAVTNTDMNRSFGVLILTTFIANQSLAIIWPSIFLTNIATIILLFSLNTFFFLLIKKHLLNGYTISKRSLIIGRILMFMYVVVMEIVFFYKFQH